MTTSGVYSFGVSRDDIVRQALLNIGKLGRYDAIDPILMKDCVIVMNMMIKQMMGNADFATGLKVWTRKRGHLFLSNLTGRYTVGPGATGWTNDYCYPVSTNTAVAGSSTINLSAVTNVGTSPITVGCNIGIVLDGPAPGTNGGIFWTTIATLVGLVATLTTPLPSQASSGAQVFIYQTVAQIPLAIEAAVLRYPDLSDYPLNILKTTQDYDFIVDKAQWQQNSSDPTAVYFETQLINAYLYTDTGSASDLTKHIVLTYQEPVQDFVYATDTPYFPPEYFLPLCWGLSKLIAPQLNRVWTQGMESVWTTAFKIGRNKDPELSSLFFQPGNE